MLIWQCFISLKCRGNNANSLLNVHRGRTVQIETLQSSWVAADEEQILGTNWAEENPMRSAECVRTRGGKKKGGKNPKTSKNTNQEQKLEKNWS